MYDFKTLETTDIETLHEAFLKAFSDYKVKIDLPLWKFKQMLKRRGYAAEISMGTFENQCLIGFILNGYRNFNDKSTIYDTGTGVIPEYRKLGITSSAFLNLMKILKGKDVEQYLLEVIKSNTSALELYKKQGFKITRDFICFQAVKTELKASNAYTAQHVDRFSKADWDQFVNFWDIIPSWQNSIDSIDAVWDSFTYSVVRLDNTIAGYGIIDKKTGDIPQIAVHKNYRHKGIAGSILEDLIKNTESQLIAVINVDNASRSMNDFCLKSGFQSFTEQYEMLLEF